MKFFCRHDWPKWSAIVNCYDGPYQFRACNKCNKVVQRSVAKSSIYVNLSVWNCGPKATNNK